jgi:hypothetical protein
MTLSTTVIRSNRPSSCRLREIPRPASWCGRSLRSSVPRQRSVPVAGWTNPHATLNNVVLPAPFGPITPSTWFGATSRETSDSATRPPKFTDTPDISKCATHDSLRWDVVGTTLVAPHDERYGRSAQNQWCESTQIPQLGWFFCAFGATLR